MAAGRPRDVLFDSGDAGNRSLEAGAPIHAVGVQAHATANLQTIDKVAAETGLPVYVTELDLDIANDDQRRQVMESHFTMFWNNPNVDAVTLWGYVEGMTWVPNSGLMSSDGDMRPAMTWLTGFLGR